jgi:hypothetical protein
MTQPSGEVINEAAENRQCPIVLSRSCLHSRSNVCSGWASKM